MFFTEFFGTADYVEFTGDENAGKAINGGKSGGVPGLSVAKKPSEDEAENKEAGHW